MKKFIFFRNDRLGDFIILTNILKSIKKKYKDSHITVVCSPLNYALVKKYKIVNQVYIHSKKNSFYKTILLLNKIISSNYYASFAVDGKSFSNICNFLIKAKYKLGLVYNYKIFNIWFSKPNFLYKYFIFDKYETFTSKKNLTKIEHLPTKLINLANYFKLNLKAKNNYYFNTDTKEKINFKKFYTKFIKRKYILIHFDEKWSDINSISDKLFLTLLNFQKKINKKIIITSYKNKNKYFLNLKNKILKNKNINILLIENSNLLFFERLINQSICSISCHSGFLVQIAGSNSCNLIDIIHKNDYNWYSSWKPKNTKHKFIFKSNINDIFNDIEIALKSYINI
ncbi:MAG: hypothetical protein CBE23_002650 [Candidatus Pelagibacter sp. TMED263]|nr:MAG: hypothetical protein CBE23_002650 [Candidatus Pelagibacter sp. TMED263]